MIDHQVPFFDSARPVARQLPKNVAEMAPRYFCCCSEGADTVPTAPSSPRVLLCGTVVLKRSTVNPFFLDLACGAGFYGFTNGFCWYDRPWLHYRVQLYSFRISGHLGRLIEFGVPIDVDWERENPRNGWRM